MPPAYEWTYSRQGLACSSRVRTTTFQYVIGMTTCFRPEIASCAEGPGARCAPGGEREGQRPLAIQTCIHQEIALFAGEREGQRPLAKSQEREGRRPLAGLRCYELPEAASFGRNMHHTSKSPSLTFAKTW